MAEYYFISENGYWEKVKTLIILISLIIFVLAIGILFSTIWYSLVTAIPVIGTLAGLVRASIVETTPMGLFYGHFLGGIFFVPSPDEVIFYYGLLKGNSFILALISAITGYLLAQILNYFLGYKLGEYLMPFVSKKKMYKARRYVNKYGSYAIFIFNLIPSPAPLITFALGIAKYNFKKLFILTLLGKLLKYLILIGIYLILIQ